MIETGCALLENRADDDQAMLLGEVTEKFGCRSGNRFGQFKIICVFGLAEIGQAVQFR